MIQRLMAICLLTVRAAFRFRLVLVMATLLIGGVVVLPIVIIDDGTARGFTQIVLTYTLALITTLLGFVTIWMACGTLAREIEEAQMQVLAVKPVARWEIWIGKWLGIMTLNFLLLGVSSGAVYGLMQWKARKLPAEQQAVLKNEIFIARGEARPQFEDFKDIAEKILKERLATPAGRAITNVSEFRQFAQMQVKGQLETVPPDYLKQFEIDLHKQMWDLKDVPVQLRLKFNVAMENLNNQYLLEIEAGDPADGDQRVWHGGTYQLPNDTFNEITVPANLFNAKGILKIRIANRNETAIQFPLDEGITVLYREGGFLMNFIRGVAIIFCWLGFLAALGLMAASFLSFNVAAFFAIGFLLVGLSSGTLKQIIEENGITGVNHETGRTDNPAFLDEMAVGLAKGLLAVLGMVKNFSPIDALSSGRSVSWSEVGMAVLQIWVIMSGTLMAIGIYTFSRRELATAQGTS
jgi:hypothetical protein